MRLNLLLLTYFVACSLLACSRADKPTQATPPNNADTTFTNPLLPAGPDPWVIQKDTMYYYTHTTGNRIVLYKTSKMSSLGRTAPVTIWVPPASGAYAKDIWAPEIHYIGNKWYVYFAADDGNNATHRIYVLENTSADPTTGTWEFKGKLAVNEDKWAIDPSILNYNGQLYLLWSGWPGDVNVIENIYIAKLKDPFTIEGPRALLSAPTYNWETQGAPPAINEGPEALVNNGRVYLTYSASGCWTDNYALGMLTLKAGGDPMKPDDWTKSARPVFSTVAGNGAYSTGHNGFFVSRDGTENWIIYHANSLAGQGCGDTRNPRMQRFTWNADGSPNFGEPVKINVSVKKPSGE